MTTTETTSTETTEQRTPQKGDYFVSSWGYDQTNIDFYQVVEVTKSGKSVKVQKVDNSTVSSEGTHDQVVPGSVGKGAWVRQPDGFSEYDPEATPPVRIHRLKSYTVNGETHWYFTVNSFSSASLWSGRPQYQTGFGYGH